MRKQIIFNVTEEDHKIIKIEAAARGISIRDFIMYCVRKIQKKEK